MCYGVLLLLLVVVSSGACMQSVQADRLCEVTCRHISEDIKVTFVIPIKVDLKFTFKHLGNKDFDSLKRLSNQGIQHHPENQAHEC